VTTEEFPFFNPENFKSDTQSLLGESNLIRDETGEEPSGSSICFLPQSKNSDEFFFSQSSLMRRLTPRRSGIP
jgi:hypothetical protein